MKIGFALPSLGHLAGPASLVKVAQRAEALGYDSLWTGERLLAPLRPQVPYRGTPDGSLPESFRRALDPLETLVFVAAHTNKVHLGTSVINIPYYNPVMLARQLTTVDVLSNGRLCVGLGLAWNKDEMDATGADMKQRGAVADEFLEVLKALWTTNPVEFQGKFFRVPRSYVDLKPVQKPHPPIYMAAFAPPAMKRMAVMTDGWNPTMIPIPGMAQMFAGAQQMAKDAGRDPESLGMIVRANVGLADRPLGSDRKIFHGTWEQIKQDFDGCRKIGASEVFFDPTFSPGVDSLDQWFALMERVRALA